MSIPIAVVRTLSTRKGRREHELFTFEGASLLEEAVAAKIPLRQVHATADAIARTPLLLQLRDSGVPLYEETAQAIARLSDLETPPGIVAVAPMRSPDLAALLDLDGPVLLLAGISDPGNAGTLVRAAEAFGAVGAVFGAGGVEPYHPKVVRAAMGSLFRVPFAVASAEDVLAAATEAQRSIVATTREGQPLDHFTFPSRAIIAVGSERHGVAGWLPRWDAAVAIPHLGPTESLNAGVAGAIVLYEWARNARSRTEKA